MLENKIPERLTTFIDYTGLNQSEFGRLLGFSQGYIGKVLKGKVDFTTGKALKIFNQFPELNPTWLFTGSGEMLFTKQSSAVKSNSS